jgi:hypothetical protein
MEIINNQRNAMPRIGPRGTSPYENCTEIVRFAFSAFWCGGLAFSVQPPSPPSAPSALLPESVGAFTIQKEKRPSTAANKMATRDRGSIGPGDALRPISIRQIFEQPMSDGEF